MGRITTQFYSMPDELLALIEGWKIEFGFHTVVMQLFPKLIVFEISNPERISQLSLELTDVFSVLMGPTKPKLDVKSRYEFLQRNKDFLIIDVGLPKEKGLGESAILGKTEDLSLYKVWKKIERDLRRSTKAGLWATNIETGAKHYYKDFRYTPGAAELSLAGAPFRSISPLVLLSVTAP